MTTGILRRTTFVVPDAAKAAQFYETVFGWTRFYDHSLVAKRGFPPVSPNDEPVKLVLLKAEDPKIGMVGFLQYVDGGLPLQLSPGIPICLVAATPRVKPVDQIAEIRV